jgi:hypothetical protein
MTAVALAPLLALLHFTGAMDLSLVQLDSLGLACFNGAGACALRAAAVSCCFSARV